MENFSLCFHSHLPKIYQSFLMSATFTEDVQALKELLLHNPVRSPAPTLPVDTRHNKSCSRTLMILCVQCCSVWFRLHAWVCALSGDPEASGLSAPWWQSAAAVQHQVWGGGQVPAHLHAAEAAAGSGQDAGVCGSGGQMLQTQAVPGTVQHSCLRSQLRAARPVQVDDLWPPFLKRIVFCFLVFLWAGCPQRHTKCFSVCRLQYSTIY